MPARTRPTRESVHAKAVGYAKGFFDAQRTARHPMQFADHSIGEKDQMQADIRETATVADPVDVVMLFSQSVADSTRLIAQTTGMDQGRAMHVALTALTTVYAELVLREDR